MKLLFCGKSTNGILAVLQMQPTMMKTATLYHNHICTFLEKKEKKRTGRV